MTLINPNSLSATWSTSSSAFRPHLKGQMLASTMVYDESVLLKLKKTQKTSSILFSDIQNWEFQTYNKYQQIVLPRHILRIHESPIWCCRFLSHLGGQLRLARAPAARNTPSDLRNSEFRRLGASNNLKTSAD